MQTRSSDENSVRPSDCQKRALWQNDQTRDMSATTWSVSPVMHTTRDRERYLKVGGGQTGVMTNGGEGHAGGGCDPSRNGILGYHRKIL